MEILFLSFRFEAVILVSVQPHLPGPVHHYWDMQRDVTLWKNVDI
jgi:hypothetical protein